MTRTDVPGSSRASPAVGGLQSGGESSAHPPRDPTFLQVFTLVVWLTCLVVGLLGLWLQAQSATPKYQPPPPLEPPPVQAEVIDVDITREPVMAADDTPPPPEAMPDAPPESPPPLPEVSAPSPGLAFAVPVEGPVRIGSGAHPGIIPRAVPAAVERLVFGKGTAENQPEPIWPLEARLAQQEGIVSIQFSVGPDGRVVEAHVARPSRWPLLNQAALTAVRDEWVNSHWVTTHPYLVSIVFKFNR